MAETRLVAMTDERVKWLRDVQRRCEQGVSYYMDHGLPSTAAEHQEDADHARFLADSYEHGITEEEARESADWIMGHRPETNSLAVGIALDRAVGKLRSAFREVEADKDG